MYISLIVVLTCAQQCFSSVVEPNWEKFIPEERRELLAFKHALELEHLNTIQKDALTALALRSGAELDALVAQHRMTVEKVISHHESELKLMKLEHSHKIIMLKEKQSTVFKIIGAVEPESKPKSTPPSVIFESPYCT